jgi:ring-1,2-phenylacetyl-CoA epoxidase subunit PaaC
MNTSDTQALFEFLQRCGDDRLVLGQRLSEWCEDIALANMALDLIGHAQATLELAGKMEGAGRNADTLAYHRETVDFRNCLLVEQPNGDFAHTIVRQFFFSVFSYLQWGALAKSSHPDLAGIAAKAQKESRYHCTHSSEWILRLGDGTEESHRRAQDAVNHLWAFTDDLFFADDNEALLQKGGFIGSLESIRPEWNKMVSEVLTEATLSIPSSEVFMHIGGRRGMHSEHLGHMLATMQIVPRSYPDASW